ncbi:MAG: 4-hydroxy-tetrahydrodipicolinate reductase [Chitinophagaceae bacterium]
MKIVLVGYGKMGKAIEEIAVQRGHEIVLKIDVGEMATTTSKQLAKADVAIEFTNPDSAFENLVKCHESGLPIVCGSTGWLDRWAEVEHIFKQTGALIYASNFSIGVNLFFELNKKLASLMSNYPEYSPELKEIHHTQKKDAPSGTAVTLAEQVLKRYPEKSHWVNQATKNPAALAVISERTDPAAGTHHVKYSSSVDDIEIIHTAHNRQGFAQGAVLAAEYIIGKTGIFTMKNVLGL